VGGSLGRAEALPIARADGVSSFHDHIRPLAFFSYLVLLLVLLDLDADDP